MLSLKQIILLINISKNNSNIETFKFY